MVIVVIDKASRLNGGTVFGRLSAPDIVGITGGISQGVGDAGRGVTAGGVGSGSDIALCVGCPDRASG
ncbi:hypothetical protein F2Y29_23205 [Bacteroides caccae]|nr:hypothetical protein [Bacteroides caccae]KAA2311283.1 hypothetical protein F2Y29_23205 [Bacteroides caccae]